VKYSEKTFGLAKIFGLEMHYEESSGLSMKFSFSYAVSKTRTLRHVGDVFIVGGQPRVFAMVQIKNNWLKKAIPWENLNIKKFQRRNEWKEKYHFFKDVRPKYEMKSEN